MLALIRPDLALGHQAPARRRHRPVATVDRLRPLDGLVVAAGNRHLPPGLVDEVYRLIGAAVDPISVVELAARIQRPLDWTVGLLDDLVASGYVDQPDAAAAQRIARPDADLIATLIERLGQGGEPATAPTQPVRIVVAGGVGSGRTTFIESLIGHAPSAVPLGANPTDGSVTFGRVDLVGGPALFTFRLADRSDGPELWERVARGALGAVVIVDTARLAASFAAVDDLERARLPFVIAVNARHGILHHHPNAVRDALGIRPYVPVVVTDARSHRAVADSVAAVAHQALALATPLPPGREQPAVAQRRRLQAV